MTTILMQCLSTRCLKVTVTLMYLLSCEKETSYDILQNTESLPINITIFG